MKIRLSTVLSILLCLVLCFAAVCIGAYRGWHAERQEILTSLTEGGELYEQLQHRGMDAANLAVVAARHLPPDDRTLSALRQASDMLLSDNDPNLYLEADIIITDASCELAQRLPEIPSFQQSERDRTYVAMLAGPLSVQSSLSRTYTQLAEDYNRRLDSSLTGRLAMFLSITPLHVQEHAE